MPALTIAVRIGLYAIMASSVLAAIGVVTLPNLFHSALCLAYTLLGIAGIYLSLHADFLAVVQILLYVGAIMTLVIFAIMLTEGFGNKKVEQNNPLGMSLLTFGGAIIFVVVFFFRIVRTTPWPVKKETLQQTVTAADLGTALMGKYVFPFEVISVIMIAALIGAILIAKKEKEA